MTYWITAVVASVRVEVRRDYHGLYRGFAKNLVRLRFHLGDRGSID
jgi:hypothetical protein